MTPTGYQKSNLAVELKAGEKRLEEITPIREARQQAGPRIRCGELRLPGAAK